MNRNRMMLSSALVLATVFAAVRMVGAQGGLPALPDMQTVRETLGNGSPDSVFPLKLHGLQSRSGALKGDDAEKTIQSILLANMGSKQGLFTGSSMPCSLEVAREGTDLTVYAVGKGPDPDHYFPGARWSRFPGKAWGLDAGKTSVVVDPFPEDEDAKLFYVFEPGSLAIRSFYWQRWGARSELCKLK